MYYLSNFCCICLNKCTDLEKLINNTESKSYYDKLFICIPQMDFNKISNTALICKECEKQVDQMYNFREICLKNNETLKGYILQLHSNGNTNGDINVELTDIIKKDDVQIIELGNGIFLERNINNPEKNPEEELKTNTSEPGNSFNCQDVTINNKNENAPIIFKKIKINDVKSLNKDLKNNDKTNNCTKQSNNCNKELKITNEDVPIILKNFKIDQTQIELKTTNITNELNESVPIIFKKLNVSQIDITPSHNEIDFMNTSNDIESNSKNVSTFNHIKVNQSQIDITSSNKNNISGDEVEFISISKDQDNEVEFVSMSKCQDDDVEFVSISNQGTNKNNSRKKLLKENKTNAVNNGFEFITIAGGRRVEFNKNIRQMVVETPNTNTGVFGNINIENINSDDYFEPEGNHSDYHQESYDDYSMKQNNEFTQNNLSSMNEQVNFQGDKSSDDPANRPVNSKYSSFDDLIDSVLTCKICFVTFPDTDALNYHIPIHKNNRVYKCYVCDEVFGKLRLLKAHKATHSNKSYTCDICNKVFTRLEQFEEHKMKHISEGPYKCEFCTKTYIKLHDLRAHESTHTNERYTCDVCHRCFYKLQHLEDHKIIHNSIRPYVCDVCNKSFYQISNLKIHKLIHTGERPHVCDVCNKAFVQISHLKSHKLVHTNERPYVCDICHKSYQQSCYLKVHKLAHTGEKPHTCKGCKRSYTRASYLRKHQNKTKCLLKLKESKKADPLYLP